MDELERSGVDCDQINNEVDKVYKEIEQLAINTKRSSLRPPK